jgi:hypothetical protein
MNDLTPPTSDGFKLIARVEALRSDQRGSLSLLAGMMVFLVTIFAIIAFDTNMAIYNRIISQNAVDAAADSAALWQARGCNLLQELNNIHYTGDTVLCVAETAAGVSCVLADASFIAEVALEASLFLSEFAPIAEAARWGFCEVCDTLPYLDIFQNIFYAAVMNAEKGIVELTPYVAFGYANAAAQGCGADTIGAVVPQYLASLSSSVSGLIPGLSGIGSLISSITGPISSFLGSIPIYAAPLDPDDFGLFDPASKGLYVTRRDNDSNPPLAWPDWVGQAGEIAGDIGCSSESADVPPGLPEAFLIGVPLPGPDFISPKGGYFDDADSDHSDYTKKDTPTQTWGWNDQYYFGWPGFSTWIAGKKEQDELLGLGNLSWLNGGMKNPDYNANGAAVSKVMYNTGSGVHNNTGGFQPFKIPAFVAIASSQVQGTPVICHGNVDARGTLIKVYFSPDSPTSGEDYYIYH